MLRGGHGRDGWFDLGGGEVVEQRIYGGGIGFEKTVEVATFFWAQIAADIGNANHGMVGSYTRCGNATHALVAYWLYR